MPLSSSVLIEFHFPLIQDTLAYPLGILKPINTAQDSPETRIRSSITRTHTYKQKASLRYDFICFPSLRDLCCQVKVPVDFFTIKSLSPSSMTSLEHARARQPEIIRCVQKDTLYLNQIRELVIELIQYVNPNRNFQFSHKWSPHLSSLLYYGFHSALRLQTLGEEYTGVVQTNKRFNSLPTITQQFLTYILEFFGQDVLERLLRTLKRRIVASEELLEEPKRRLCGLMDFLITSLPYAKVLHLGAFYMTGGKYQISKRLTGLNYVLYNYLGRPKGFLRSYRWLGVITFLQMAVVFYKYSRKSLKGSWKTLGVASKSVEVTKAPSDVWTRAPSTEKCILCLENRTKSSATSCGHVFCWDCILNCLRTRSECPVCREPVKSQGVLFLMNYA